MTRKRRRLSFVVAGMVLLGAAAALVLSAFEDNLVFFYSPSEIAARAVAPDRRVRIGGLVEEASVVRTGLKTQFRVTDTAHTLSVSYHGLLPDLFREGQGVVAEGAFDRSGLFIASEVLAKHDGTYMPPEVAAALKKAGRWRGGEGGQP